MGKLLVVSFVNCGKSTVLPQQTFITMLSLPKSNVVIIPSSQPMVTSMRKRTRRFFPDSAVKQHKHDQCQVVINLRSRHIEMEVVRRNRLQERNIVPIMGNAITLQPNAKRSNHHPALLHRNQHHNKLLIAASPAVLLIRINRTIIDRSMNSGWS